MSSDMAWQKLFDMKPGEHVEIVKRRHPITFIPQIVIFAVSLAIPPILIRMVLGADVAIANPLLHAAGVLLLGMYYLGVNLFFMGQFVDYYLDITIVTNDRIIDIEQKGIFGRQISELDLARIQDVNSEVKGIIASMFNYGLVEIQTAGDEANFEMADAHDPHGVRQRIIELSALDRKREARELMEAKNEPVKEEKHPLDEQGL